MLPVAAREVREASRQSRTYAWRWITASVALGVLTFVAWITRNNAFPGNNVFAAVSTVAFIYCLLAPVVRTADSIAEEKRDNTLGLLFLTDLKGWDILLGKVLSSSVNCFFGLLAFIPLLAVPMMMGGVQWSEFARVVVSLINALLLSISWGFLISSLFRSSVVTISMGLGAMLFVGAGIPIASIFIDEKLRWDGFADFVMIFTPVHTQVFAFDHGGRRKLFESFWLSLLINHAFVWINLRLAIYCLPRFWQETPKNRKSEQWRERFRAWRFGRGKQKIKLRTRLLNQNPLSWLANREQVSSFGLMAVCFLILVGGLLMGLATNGGRTDELFASWAVALAIVHLLIAFRMSMAATFRVAEDRRSGALELLLATEVSVKEILRGQMMALRRQFLGPALIAFFGGLFSIALALLVFAEELKNNDLFETFIEIISRLGRPGANPELGFLFILLCSIQMILALNWIGLTWVGLWVGLREKRSGLAMWIALAIVYPPPWLLLICGIAAAGEGGLLQDARVAIPIVMSCAWALGILHLALVTTWARKNLLTRFRAVAADRFMTFHRFPWRLILRVIIKFACGIALFFFALLAVREFINNRGEKAWQAARARYPRFSFALEVPKAAPVSDQRNLAKASIFAKFERPIQNRINTSEPLLNQFVTFNRGDSLYWEWTQRRRTHLYRVEEHYLDRKYIAQASTNMGLSVLEGMKPVDDELAELAEEARARPFTRLVPFVMDPSPSTYGSLMNFWFDPRSSLRNVVNALALRASAKIASGAPSLDDILLGHRVAESFANLPESVQRYHEVLVDLTQPIYDGLAANAWNETDLAKIQSTYEAIDVWTGFQLALTNYSRLLLVQLDRRIEGRLGKARTRERWLARKMPVGLLRERQAKILEWSQAELPKVIFDGLRRIDLNAFKKMEANRPDLELQTRYQDPLKMLIQSVGFTQTTLDLVIVACAIERYEIAHKKLPERLDDLVPRYLRVVPLDIFTGAPLIYSKKEDGRHFRLYGVGADGVDDKGNVSFVPGSWHFWQTRPGLDLVWDSEIVETPKPESRKQK